MCPSSLLSPWQTTGKEKSIHTGKSLICWRAQLCISCWLERDSWFWVCLSLLRYSAPQSEGLQAHSDVLVSQKLTAHNATGMILCTSQMLIGSQVGLNRKMTSSWSGNTKWTFFIVFNTDVHFNLLNVTTVVLSAAGWRTSNNTNSHSPHTGDSKLL